MMVGVLLAKSIADLSFGGAFAWYLVKFLISMALAVCGVLLGMKWRKSKNAKKNA
ncbi:MAG: hypothetical protein J5979_02685 [Lachnospiraceae bacterium]|nr:hypothetical protein [Lachnospiraceae bacterium]